MKNFPPLIKLLACAVFLLTAALHGFAQPSTGVIKGTVTDQLSGLVTNATVVLKNGKLTGKTTTTDNEGNYEIRGLPPGKYDLTISAIGFQTLEESSVEVRASKIDRKSVV